MKRFLLFLLTANFLSLPCNAAQTVFMSGFEDLPLMDGLKQSDDASVSFDSPSGRIIEAYAQSDETGKRKIAEFYDKTLPQLGWRRVPAGKGKTAAYAREGEILTISIDDGTSASVRFELMTREKE